MSDSGFAADHSSLAAQGQPSERPHLGQRMVVRVRTGQRAESGNPELTDVVGVLETVLPAEAGRPETWHLRRRDGSLTVVEHSDIVVTKAIPSPPVRLSNAHQISVRALEEIAARGWQPLESAELGGWRLRAAQGFTGRANSVLPLGEPDQPIDLALDRVTQWYAERDLPAQFQVPLPLSAPLDDALDALGWTAKNPTRVMVADLGEVLMMTDLTSGQPPVQWSDRPSAAWLSTYRYRGAALPSIAATVMTNSDEPIFASVPDPSTPDGPLVAVGRAAVNDGWLGITGLEVTASAQRRGLGTHVVRALVEYAYQRGHRHAYLQVATENQAAHALYERMGFRQHHTYLYRVSPGSR